MEAIVHITQCFSAILDKKTLKQLNLIAEAMLGMRGRITMLGISRWSETGAAYRTIQRFFNQTIDWLSLNVTLITTHLPSRCGYLLAADEVIITKSGTKTYGLDRFFSSLQSQTVKGIAFLDVTLINIETRKANSLLTRQIIKPEKEGCSKVKPKNRPVGRPRGSKNKNRKDVPLAPYLQWVQAAVNAALEALRHRITVRYFAFDGAFGNNAALQMVRRTGLHLISKLKSNSALYLPPEGKKKTGGAPRKYGDKLNYDHLPTSMLKQSAIDGTIQTLIYSHPKLLSKSFADPINVVIIVKINLQTHKSARIILLSSDPDLSFETLIDYYSLRFQIEFLFRDMKQHWGAEDFMNVNETPLYNAVNLSAFMVNLSFPLRQAIGGSDMSVNNLKAHYHGLKYAKLVLQLLPQIDDPIFIQTLFEQLSTLGAIESSGEG